MSARLAIAGFGYALPERIVGNDEVAGMIDTSDAFIRERTGVVARRYLAPDQHLADLACPAAERALADAGITARDVDLLIVNTLSPDHHDPSQACYIQPRLGLREVPCFDIRAQCSGGLYGIEIARHFLASGLYRNVLLICAEALSRRIDTSNAGRNLSILLSDGAAALLLQATDDPARGLIDLTLGADGTQFDLLSTEAPGARRPRFIDEDDIAAGRHYFRMKGAPMFEDATRRIVDACRQMLDKHRLTIGDIGLVVPHQPNLRILDAVIERLGLPRERCMISVDQLGNMASAAFPVALALAHEQGRMPAGQLNLLVTYGAGATWACALYRS
ncbi:ketoacyl-ACP synthase III [Burkholderia stagnalis]|uniref:Ketoacyl-ACP synthase III n=1 Tax=Burkholderia stagnalis TaxID=1503054 RepID=A0A6L3MNX2_9BURK|nr:ketoacyl-ACP synthase III [Burkholderia stagnalis]KAB0633726.1 ketoacyl-ACP synthase III [Burkholderia stagnalis]KVD92033.1 3-oxoacyl-ACP synthase [Burkholderia stagnalis]KVL89349.1 3-oxoacyl-ACP synthase [Burkholderia stagnalis]KVM00850.1 3-oxoacyl-ACP synthase [Burkholderia stagnalis]KVM75931.1 3-oxoacyl-ACP synthase [Burkholderia stagnalis]